MAGQIAGIGHSHLAHQTEPIDVRLQRAQTVRQQFRQHRDHEAGEIHRVAAVQGFGIERGAAPDIMTDIGNRHPQPPTAGFLALAINGVVKILGVFTIDGDQRQLAQIDPALLVGFQHHRCQRSDFFFHRWRKFVRQIELANGDLDLHAGREVIPEHLDHFRQRLAQRRHPRRQLHHHHLAVIGAELIAGRNDQFLADTRIAGLDKRHAALLEETANHMPRRRTQHFDDQGFNTALAITALRGHQHPIAVHGFAHFALGQHPVIAAFIENDKTETVAVTFDAAGFDIHLARQAPEPAPVLHQLAVTGHGAQPAVERDFVFFAVQAEPVQDGRERQRRAFLGQKGQDEFPARDGVVVLGLFAVEMRVGGRLTGHGVLIAEGSYGQV